MLFISTISIRENSGFKTFSIPVKVKTVARIDEMTAEKGIAQRNWLEHSSMQEPRKV